MMHGVLEKILLEGDNTNIAIANLTADDNRTYDQNGNDLTIDPNGGVFFVSDQQSALFDS